MNKHFSSQRNNKVVVKEKSISYQVYIERITHLTCESYITTVHTIDSEKIVVSRLLKHFEIELAEYGFLRINRNTVVNGKNILNYRNGGEACVMLLNNEKIKISRRKLHLLKEYFKNQ